MRQPSRRLRGVAVSALVVVVLAGCGVPAGDDPRPVADSDVPYGLLDPDPATAGSDQAEQPTRTEPKVYWLADDDQIVATAADVEEDELFALVDGLLSQLAVGPDDVERADGLSTALGPDVGLDLVEIRATTAVVDVQPSSEVPSADRLPLAVGQIVLSVVSAPGIDQVMLERDGEPIEVPLPGGVLTSDSLTAADYRELTTSERVD